MGYSSDSRMVRVDFFKPSGTWQATEAIEWTGGWEDRVPIHDAFMSSLRHHFESKRGAKTFAEFDAICLEPYHHLSHPIMLKAGSWL